MNDRTDAKDIAAYEQYLLLKKAQEVKEPYVPKPQNVVEASRSSSAVSLPNTGDKVKQSC